MRYTLGLLITLLLVVSAAYAGGELSGGEETSIANINDTSNATFTVVTGTASKTIRAHGWTLSTNGADTLTVKCGTTAVWGPHYLGTNAGTDPVFYPLRFKCGSGEALNITKGVAGTGVTATVFYTKE